MVVPSTGPTLGSSTSAGVNTSSAGSSSGSVTLTGGSGTGGTITVGGGSSGGGSGHVNPPAVPEPEEYVMMLVGAALVGYRVRRKQGKAG